MSRARTAKAKTTSTARHSLTRPLCNDLSWAQVHKNIIRIDISFKSMNDSQWFLLRGDAHHDNPHSDHEKQFEDLYEAQRRGAGIIDVGDLFCAMGGRADPRRSRHGSTREEHVEAADYFDSLVRHNAEFLRPYARNIIGIGMGNHETSVRKNQETDLTARLVERINAKEGTNIINAGYGCYYAIAMQCFGRRTTSWMHTYHGSGGGGMMSFDTLRVRRQSSFHPMADILVSGHVHERWALETTRVVPASQNGVYTLTHEPQWHVRTGTYKQEFDMAGGFHFERGAPPKPIGAMWMKASIVTQRSPTRDGRTTYPRFEFTPT
jgi:hypothetical protein